MWMEPRIWNQIIEGAADIRFVLDRTTAENGDREHFFLAGKIDLNRVAAMGHSACADFAARACQLGIRVKACVALEGGMPPIAALPDYPDHASLKQPLLLLEAYHPESRTAGTPPEHAAVLQEERRAASDLSARKL